MTVQWQSNSKTTKTYTHLNTVYLKLTFIYKKHIFIPICTSKQPHDLTTESQILKLQLSKRTLQHETIKMLY